jgi:hypothetical protein
MSKKVSLIIIVLFAMVYYFTVYDVYSEEYRLNVKIHSVKEANVKRQVASKSRYTLETDKGDFYVDMIQDIIWATAVNKFTDHVITSSRNRKITVYYDNDRNIVGIEGEKGSISK